MSGKKIAIVTGASSGMGREMVYLLADHFAALEEIWVSRQDEKRPTRGSLSERFRSVLADPAASIFHERGGPRRRLSGLLKQRAAERQDPRKRRGIRKDRGRRERSRADLSAGMVRLNDEALVAVTEMVLPYISRNSRIIQFASAAAFMPQPGFAVYAASKSFVLSYSRALAVPS